MENDFFNRSYENFINKNKPLADKMRPETLDEFFGQEHIISKGKMLRRMIEADMISSIILHGPTGSGKTTLGKIIAQQTEKTFKVLNAVTSGVKDIKKYIQEAIDEISMHNRQTIVFIDEIHRFNKLQQDALLPYVENGTIILIGATTENPYFEVNNALLSRSTIFELKSLSPDDIKKLLQYTLENEEKGLGKKQIAIQDEALELIANYSNGDGRKALNALELAVVTTSKNKEGKIEITRDVAKESIQKNTNFYDKNGDKHYDYISAFIKSMRGSDPDAALFYLAKMLVAGEDPKFLGRRIIICASEDVGNADPNALEVAVNAFKGVEIIGMPEGRILLAQAVVYIACAPKSNTSYMGINKAMSKAEKSNITVPSYLKDESYKQNKDMSDGIYKYPHNYKYNYVKQRYLPEGIKEKFYIPGAIGYEKKMKKYLEYLDNLEKEVQK
ncbi:MAG: replication-associated recombination protein A [Bacillota bacterium]|nr:replication-associated recombination protein A [Bacillota bacterium]